MEYTIDLMLRLLDDLDSFKRMIEWNYPMTYQVEINKVIEIINEVKEQEEMSMYNNEWT